MADAQHLADCGVDIIIGSHPHVVQKSAWLNSSDDAHRTFVAYSLGNTLFDQPSPPDAHSGLLLKITLENQDSIRVQPVPLEIDWATGKTRLAQGETVISVLEQFNLPVNFQTPSPTQ
jgi:poly-gamma-glutamate synthesis protein (capsule biosynthesis protein)